MKLLQADVINWKALAVLLTFRRLFRAFIVPVTKLTFHNQKIAKYALFIRFFFSKRSLFWRYSYLVDLASSHMLVSKIKPCMSKYKSISVCIVKLPARVLNIRGFWICLVLWMWHSIIYQSSEYVNPKGS